MNRIVNRWIVITGREINKYMQNEYDYDYTQLRIILQ